MVSRGLNLGGDIDNLIPEEGQEAVVKKFLLTKNCKKETALRWAFQRAQTKADRERIQKVAEEYFATGDNLIDD